MSEIKLDSIHKSFGKVEVIHDANIQIEDGEFVVFVGPSGCGKSTLLRLIAGLEEITSGELSIGNRVVNELNPKERGIAMVFQSYALYPHLTVYQNMAFGLKLGKSGKKEIKRRVHAAAEALELTEYLKRRPAQLSGGQRQRVAIGRAIVRKPKVFLFDEPLSNLDAALRVQTRLEIAKLHQDLQTTIVYVTHDQVEAMTLADKIVVLKDGRVEQVGAPLDIYHRPANLFVAGFIGSPKMNFIPAKVLAVTEKGAEICFVNGDTIILNKVVSESAVGKKVTVGVRPEHLIWKDNSQSCQITTTIEVIEHLGDISYLYTKQSDGTPVVVSMAGTSQYKIGEKITVSVENENIHLFAEDGYVVS